MTPRERVKLAAQHKSADIVPHQLDATAGMDRVLAEHFGTEGYVLEVLDNHILREKNKRHVFDETGYTDLFGVHWRVDASGGMGVPERPPLTEPRADWICMPVPDEERIRRQIRTMIQRHPERFHLFELGLALFERAWTLRGMENLLVDMIEEPAFVDALLERIAEYDRKVIDIAASEGIDGVMLGDDWGQQHGLIMGRPHWRRFIRPHIRALYERIRGYGLIVFQHSCGDNRELLGDLIDLGLDVYNTFQPEIYDVEEFARTYGRNLTIFGGISTQGVLRFGTPGQVREATRRMMDLLGPMGYIASPTHQVSIDIPVDNLLAFQEAVSNQ